VLSATDIRKEYVRKGRTFPVLREVSLHIERGEIISIIGRSGAGKSTLARIVGGVSEPTSGRITLDGRPVEKSFRVSFMFQNYGHSLFPWLSVLNNVRIGARSRYSKSLALDALDVVRLKNTANLRPGDLSAGMQQRVTLARALASKADLMILDEPFAALDYVSRIELECELLEVTCQQNLMVLHVTHDLETAIALSKRILVLKDGIIDGVIDTSLRRGSAPLGGRGTPEFDAARQTLWSMLRSEGGTGRVDA
jgi:NitT/TauT family transport system ATP-binding protein